MADLREYQAHDDIRRIDWNVTARTTIPHVRDYFEEREVTAWFIVDTSASMQGQAAYDIVMTLAQALARGQHRVGLVLSNGRNQPNEPLGATATILRPGSGRQHLLRIAESLESAFRPTTKPQTKRSRWRRHKDDVDPTAETDLAAVIALVQPHLTRKSLVFIVSDFLATTAWGAPTREIAIRHEVVALQPHDPDELRLSDGGLRVLQDAETGEQITINADDKQFRDRVEAAAARRNHEISHTAMTAGADFYRVDTSVGVVESLVEIARDRTLRMTTQRGNVG